MLLTVSKRLEFSASRRLFFSPWTDRENLAAFGPETAARYGSGRNYTAYFIFSGRVDPVTGMLINISEIKKRAGEIVDERFDHKFLNEDNPAFRQLPPTAENIARQLFADVAPSFADVDAKLVACHLIETPDRSATFYFDGACEGNYWFEFSAARQTMSPRLTAAENQRLFGAAATVHGHNYRTRLTFRKEKADGPIVRQRDVNACIKSLHEEFDHLYLAEATIGGNYDERSGTLYDFVAFQKALNESIAPWQDRHLDVETEDFRKISSTGENIVHALWSKIDSRVNQQLVRLRLWETKNNRFTLRRTA